MLIFCHEGGGEIILLHKQRTVLNSSLNTVLPHAVLTIGTVLVTLHYT